MNILIINDLSDILTTNKTHFSDTKGLFLSESFANNDDVKCLYFLSKSNQQLYRNFILFNIDDLTKEFLNSIHFILFIRESLIELILTKLPLIKNILDDQERHQIIGVKSDSIEWIKNKALRKWIKKEYNISDARNWLYQSFDIVYVQTPELLNGDYVTTGKCGKSFFIHDNKNKILISDMAINKLISNEQYSNPFTLNHDYCVDKIVQNKAFFPLMYTKQIINNYNCDIKDFNKNKKIIIYTGRIKIDNGNILYLMRDIFLKLGNDYELHIYPGRFIIPDTIFGILSPKDKNHLQLLRDKIFCNCNNVIIHFPYKHEDRFKILNNANCGLDFSQSRPLNIKSIQGNAKLLEYAGVGLPCVIESNINNSWLIKHKKSGYIIDNSFCDLNFVDEYAKGIQYICNNSLLQNKEQRFKNGEYIRNTQNWDIRATQIIKDYNDKKNNY